MGHETRVTIRDIALRVGLSKTTVSHALLGRPRIAKATRARVEQAARALGYKPNPILAQLMTEMRAGRGVGFQGKLGLVNANPDRLAFQRHPTVPIYVEGCLRRAAQLGYSFDRFWLHDDTLSATAWRRMLQTRNIRGLLLIGLMDRPELPRRLAGLWEEFPCVVTGVRTRNPELSFTCVDHFYLALNAVERALALGYRKPALVLDHVIDRLVDGRFSAGILAGQNALPPESRVPAFTASHHGRTAPPGFKRWLDTYKPDVVFILYNAVFDWLAEAGRPAPRDIGVVQLEWRSSKPEIAGMNQHNDVVGEAAVDLLVGQIYRQDVGVTPFPRATMISATWTEGSTVRRRT